MNVHHRVIAEVARETDCRRVIEPLVRLRMAESKEAFLDTSHVIDEIAADVFREGLVTGRREQGGS